MATILTLDDLTLQLILTFIADFESRFGRYPTPQEVRTALLEAGG